MISCKVATGAHLPTHKDFRNHPNQRYKNTLIFDKERQKPRIFCRGCERNCRREEEAERQSVFMDVYYNASSEHTRSGKRKNPYISSLQNQRANTQKQILCQTHQKPWYFYHRANPNTTSVKDLEIEANRVSSYIKNQYKKTQRKKSRPTANKNRRGKTLSNAEDKLHIKK